MKKKIDNGEFVIKMFMIGRDLMVGNPRLAELGFEEEAVGHHALVAGFQGQRSVDRPFSKWGLYGNFPQYSV
ncbi:hypothetical protein AK84_01860 [Streptococcus pneumoniae K2557]|nr:hypothetical protein AK84_01860 [Streptococcus pneumoniae K2557]